MTLIEAPRSSMASVKVQSPMVQATIKVPGSLHFCGMVDGGRTSTLLLCISVETFMPNFTCSFPLASSYDCTNPSRTLHILESFYGIQEGNIDFFPLESLKKIRIKLHFLCRNGSKRKR